MVDTVLIVLDVLTGMVLIFLILLHSGRGGGLSDMFGGGTSAARWPDRRWWNATSTA